MNRDTAARLLDDICEATLMMMKCRLAAESVPATSAENRSMRAVLAKVEAGYDERRTALVELAIAHMIGDIPAVPSLRCSICAARISEAGAIGTVSGCFVRCVECAKRGR